MSVRAIYLDCLDVTAELLTHPALVAGWTVQSALASFGVSGLAGHLLRSATGVEEYLDRDPPGPATQTAASYYVAVLSDDDLAGALHQGIRDRGEQAAAGGPRAVADEWRASTGRLRRRLAEESPDRRVRVFADHVLTLDDYLVTRIVEVCVHGEDLAVSIGVPPPTFPSAATAAAVSTLIEVGRLRHGDRALLLALARRERDTAEALRVL